MTEEPRAEGGERETKVFCIVFDRIFFERGGTAKSDRTLFEFGIPDVAAGWQGRQAGTNLTSFAKVDFGLEVFPGFPGGTHTYPHM